MGMPVSPTRQTIPKIARLFLSLKNFPRDKKQISSPWKSPEVTWIDSSRARNLRFETKVSYSCSKDGPRSNNNKNKYNYEINKILYFEFTQEIRNVISEQPDTSFARYVYLANFAYLQGQIASKDTASARINRVWITGPAWTTMASFASVLMDIQVEMCRCKSVLEEI